MSRGAGAVPQALRRSAPALVLGILCLLVAIPATDDLDALLRTVGIGLLVIGAVVALATVLSRPA
jgi:hypothetical protein